MIRLALMASTLLLPISAHAQTVTCPSPPNWVGTWSSYQTTGNPSDIKTSTEVGNTIGQAAQASGGVTVGLTACNPSIKGGSATGTAISGGSATGTDTSAATSVAQNSIASGTFARTLADRAASMPQPGDFLGAGQSMASLVGGSVDVGPIVNTMISGGIRTIHFPCGTYKLATSIVLVNSASISGDGACTILSVQNAGADMITGSSVSLVRIHDLTMQADVTRTGGAAIKFYRTYENHIFRVWFTNGSGKHYTNIYLDGANSTHIDAVTGRGGAWNGITVTGSAGRSEDTYISNTNFNGYSGSAIELIWASGVFMNGLDLLGSTNGGIVIDPGSSQEVDGVRATGVLSDSNIGPGWLLSGTGNITEFSMVNSWGSTNGLGGAQAGFDAENNNISNASIVNSEFHTNTGPGIKINAGQHWVVNANTICMNSLYGSAAYSGMEIGANPNFLVVTSNLSGACGMAMPTTASPKSLQAYAVKSAQPASDAGHYALFGNNMGAGNQTGGFSIGTGTNVTTANNVGY